MIPTPNGAGDTGGNAGLKADANAIDQPDDGQYKTHGGQRRVAQLGDKKQIDSLEGKDRQQAQRKGDGLTAQIFAHRPPGQITTGALAGRHVFLFAHGLRPNRAGFAQQATPRILPLASDDRVTNKQLEWFYETFAGSSSQRQCRGCG